MAKVKQFKMVLGLDPARRYKETILTIHYDTGRGSDVPDNKTRFYLKLPQIMADALNKPDIRGASVEEVKRSFDAALEEFKKLKVEKSKVILYEFELDPHPNPKEPRYSGPAHFNRGYAVTVVAAVYEETIAISGVGEKMYSYELQESSLSYPGGDKFQNRQGWNGRGRRVENQIPWTERGEAFFKWVADNMQQLISALADIESPNKLIDMVNAGRLLPLGGEKGKE
ncbi:MAG: hypothetical protein PHO67_07795 [Candidatus Omnitrophica bacterium]|nr:hypothetical protein [Candidatus Omnitrophota bacterium]